MRLAPFLIGILAGAFAVGSSSAAQADSPPHWVQRLAGTAPPGPDELQCRWLGTAGFEIRTARTTVLIDPFFTRVSLTTLLKGPIRPNPAMIRPYLHATHAVFVGHSHWDHLLDAPTIARMTGATLYGSDDSLRVARAEGLPGSQTTLLRAHGIVTVGDLTVEAIPSVHSHIVTQWFVAGDMPKTVTTPMGFLSYKHGPVYGFVIRWRGRALYHSGSADFVDSEMSGRHIDVLLQCLAGWKSSPHLWERLRDRLQPRVIVPMHHDDFFKPLSAGYHEVMFADTRNAYTAIRRTMSDVTLIPLDPLEGIRLQARDAAVPAAK
jgi:L-ascorbate metabolism protein UlaG (beta-lactamase superfamily)